LLLHDAARSPARHRVVESLVRGSGRVLGGVGHSSLIKARKIAYSVIGSSRHHPRIAAATERVAESVIILKQKRGLGAQRGVHCIPVDRVRRIDIEVGHDRPPCLGHIGRRGKVFLLNVLKLTDQRLLRRASLAGVPLDRTLVNHDRKGEARMLFRLGHHQLHGLIRGTARTIPIDDHTIDAAADHVVDLPRDLAGIGRAVADVHVA
jgi:hypothetical protein